ncbi:MAG TPA: site-2 protease family protein [Candidatus Acidoferrum sp.]
MPELNADTLVFGFIWYVAFLFSTTCHEASHALVAKLGGDDTAERGGQVTLNPIPHIRREPWGMVVIPILAFLFANTMIGWASAPFNPEWERRYPRRAAWMALAGPAANFTLMLIAAILMRFGRVHEWFVASVDHASLLGTILWVFFRLNLLLGCFNLLPVPPLDGSAGIMVFMGNETAHSYLDWLRTTPYRSLGLLAAILGFRYLYGPIESFATNLLIFGKF